ATIPTSPRESEIGLPTLRVSASASSSPCSSTSVASRRRRRTRSPGETARQGGNAAFARATAASVSSTPAESSSAIGSSVAGLTTCTVLARLLDERLEQRRVLTGLGVPEDADREPLRRVLERLDRPVLGARRLAQAGADAPEALMMVRLHRHTVADERAEPRRRVDLDVVIGEDTGHVLVLLVADDVRHVLHDIAAARHVPH